MSQNTHGLYIFTYCGGHRRFSKKRIDVSKYSGSDYFILLFVNQVVWSEKNYQVSAYGVLFEK